MVVAVMKGRQAELSARLREHCEKHSVPYFAVPRYIEQTRRPATHAITERSQEELSCAPGVSPTPADDLGSTTEEDLMNSHLRRNHLLSGRRHRHQSP